MTNPMVILKVTSILRGHKEEISTLPSSITLGSVIFEKKKLIN
jgi:hypothetical protein